MKLWSRTGSARHAQLHEAIRTRQRREHHRRRLCISAAYRARAPVCPPSECRVAAQPNELNWQRVVETASSKNALTLGRNEHDSDHEAQHQIDRRQTVLSYGADVDANSRWRCVQIHSQSAGRGVRSSPRGSQMERVPQCARRAIVASLLNTMDIARCGQRIQSTALRGDGEAVGAHQRR